MTDIYTIKDMFRLIALFFAELLEIQIQLTYTIMKELIAEYANDHYEHFGFYPADVEVNGILLTYAEYQKILAESN